MFNFNHEENTISGIRGAHDRVLVLFQDSECFLEHCPVTSPDNFTLEKGKRVLATS
jgi:hypothetical protein